jgi:hypothetical protein
VTPRSLLGKHGLANLRECLPYGDIGEDHHADIREYGELSTLRQAIVRGAFPGQHGMEVVRGSSP